VYLEEQAFRFPTGRFVGDACGVFSRNFLPLFAAYLVVSLVLNFASCLGLFLTGPFAAGMAWMSLRAVCGEAVRFEDVFKLFSRFMPTMILGLVQYGIVLAGFVVFGLPTLAGIAWAMAENNVVALFAVFFVGGTLTLLPLVYVLFYFTPGWFFILDDRVDWYEALVKSHALVKRQRAAWLGFLVPVSLLHLAITLTCIGALVATPWIFLCFALAFLHQTAAEARGEGGPGGPPPVPGVSAPSP